MRDTGQRDHRTTQPWLARRIDRDYLPDGISVNDAVEIMSADARSITGELREYARNPFYCVTWHSTNNVLSIADRIDARFTAELTAKQDEIADLQARLDASILPPVDIDGKA